MARGDVVTRIIAKDQTAAGLTAAKSKIGSFARDAATITTGVIGGQIVSQAAFAAVRALQSEIRKGFDFAVGQERLRLQLGYVVDDVKSAMDFIKTFSAETPFMLQDVSKAYRLMATVIGGSSAEIEAHTRRFADGFALSTAESGADMARFAQHYVKVVSQLETGNDDILESLKELSFNGFQVMVNDINKLAKAGDHTAALNLFIDGMERSKGGADLLSQSTYGLISTFAGLKVQLTGLLAEEALPYLKSTLRETNEQLSIAIKHFEGEDIDVENNWIVKIAKKVVEATEVIRNELADVEATFAAFAARMNAFGEIDFASVRANRRGLVGELMDAMAEGDKAYEQVWNMHGLERRVREIARLNNREGIGRNPLTSGGGGSGGGGGGGGVGVPSVDADGAVKVSVVRAPGLTGAGQPLDYAGHTGGQLGSHGQPLDYGETPTPFIRTRPLEGFGYEAMLPDIRDTLTVADENRLSIGDVAHEDAQRSLNVAVQTMHGVTQLVRAAQQGGKRGFFGALGGFLSTIAPFVPGPWQLPMAFAGGTIGAITSFSGGGSSSGNDRVDRARNRGLGVSGSGVITVNVNTDSMASDMGHAVSSTR